MALHYDWFVNLSRLISLVLVHTTKIYMDEGGVRYYYGSFVMKQAGGYAYLAFSSTFNVVNCCEKATNKKKKSKPSTIQI